MRLFLLFCWRHRLFKLEPTCHQNKSQIQDVQWGTNCTCIAAETRWATIYGQSSSEIQARFLQSAVLQDCYRFSPEHCLSFTILGGFFAPHSYLFCHLSYIFLDSKSSWLRAAGDLATPPENTNSMQNSGFNQQRPGRRFLTDGESTKLSLRWVFLRAKNHRIVYVGKDSLGSLDSWQELVTLKALKLELYTLKFCEHVKQLLQPHEAKAQSRLVHTCTNRKAFNKLSMNVKVQVYGNGRQKIKRKIQRILMKRGEVATIIFIHSSECHHILGFVLL